MLFKFEEYATSIYNNRKNVNPSDFLDAVHVACNIESKYKRAANDEK